MTIFLISCAVMLVAALVWVVLPLLRAKAVTQDTASRRERLFSSAALALLVPVLAASLYAGLSDWDWDASTTETAMQADMEQALQSLRTKLESNPADVERWLMLGRSYAALGRFALALDAFQNAYQHSKGENVEALVGLGEALTVMDETSLRGRAGELFEAALARDPNHPKALWYGAVVALRAGDVQRGRDRMKLLLAQNPPEQLRDVLERQVQDLDQQLAGGAGTAPPAQPAAAAEGAAPSRSRVIRVAVSLAPAIREQLIDPLPLFILARDPAGGPPLAVQRHSSADLPLSVELSERDAMIAARSIATVPRVQVVARLSRSGTPQAQRGDFYGEANYEFAKNPSAEAGTLNIMIDRIVP